MRGDAAAVPAPRERYGSLLSDFSPSPLFHTPPNPPSRQKEGRGGVVDSCSAAGLAADATSVDALLLVR